MILYNKDTLQKVFKLEINFLVIRSLEILSNGSTIVFYIKNKRKPSNWDNFDSSDEINEESKKETNSIQQIQESSFSLMKTSKNFNVSSTSHFELSIK